MTTLLALCVVLCVYLAGKSLIFAAECAADRKTHRVVYINEAWRRATVVDVHYGVQYTRQQEDKMLGELYDELCIPTGWTQEEIDAIDADPCARISYC
jgi:hypothetical protein